MNELSLDEIKKVELDMLRYIVDICNENKIDYFLVGGTLLGAIRHKGFIPWDDDIDIGLKRKEYDKLINILSKKKSKSYKLLNHDIEPTYFYPYSKLVNINTSLKRENCKEISDYGVYIDIFAYENVSENVINRRCVCIRKKLLKQLISVWATEEINDKNVFKRLIKKILKVYAEKIGINKILEKYNKLHEKSNKQNTKYWICNWPGYSLKNEIQEVKLYEELIDCKFEDLNVKIPKEYDKILTQLYGDYMTPPPEDKRTSLHDGVRYWNDRRKIKQ